MIYKSNALSLLARRKNLKTTRLVASSKVLHNAIPTQNCDIIMTLPANTDDATLLWLLARLRDRQPDLHIHLRHWKNTGVYAFYMTAEYDDLLRGAEGQGIFKPLKPEFGGGQKEFLFEDRNCYEGVEDEAHFLSTEERQNIVYQILLNVRAMQGDVLRNTRFLEGQSIVPLLQTEKIVSQVFPLHDNHVLARLKRTWVQTFTTPQPLDDICEYFGVKIAMYFAYLGHYTGLLMIPTALGILVWFMQTESQVVEDVCFVSFAMFNVFWATMFVEAWQRRSSELAYKWGTLDKKDELLQDPRPLFTGELVTSAVTGRLEPLYPTWKRNLFFYFISLPTIAFCLLIVFCVMLVIFELQEWVNELVKQESVPSWVYFLPKIFLAIVIFILDEIYKKIAVWLNDKENYRMEEVYENHLIIKLVLFVNSFLSLFYIAFYIQDVDRLRDQLAALMITRQVIGNLREALLPYILWKMRLVKVGYNITGRMSPTTLEREIKYMTDSPPSAAHHADAHIQLSSGTQGQGEGHSGEGHTSEGHSGDGHTIEGHSGKGLSGEGHSGEGHTIEGHSDEGLFGEGHSDKGHASEGHSGEGHTSEGRSSELVLTQAEVESTMKRYEDTFDDYLEMFIQYGYVILFSSAFPLAALCALLNNMIEIRSDAFKLCVYHQRPFGSRVQNIGIWQDALRVMGIVAVVVNSALIGVSGQLTRMVPDLGPTSVIIIIIVLEHAILVLKMCITYAIPSQPHWIKQEMARLEFHRRQALKSMEMSSPPCGVFPSPVKDGKPCSPKHAVNKPATCFLTKPPIPQRHHTSALSKLTAMSSIRHIKSLNTRYTASVNHGGGDEVTSRNLHGSDSEKFTLSRDKDNIYQYEEPSFLQSQYKPDSFTKPKQSHNASCDHQLRDSQIYTTNYKINIVPPTTQISSVESLNISSQNQPRYSRDSFNGNSSTCKTSHSSQFDESEKLKHFGQPSVSDVIRPVPVQHRSASNIPLPAVRVGPKVSDQETRLLARQRILQNARRRYTEEGTTGSYKRNTPTDL